jgi:hypothetical protein
VALTGNVSTLRARASGSSGEPDPSDMLEPNPKRLNPKTRGRPRPTDHGPLTLKQTQNKGYKENYKNNAKKVSITAARSTSSY